MRSKSYATLTAVLSYKAAYQTFGEIEYGY